MLKRFQMFSRLAIRFGLAAAAITTIPCGAFAWGPDGHKIICTIAWDEMTPGARDRVKAILHLDTRADFADTCNWADEYRATHMETIGWHIVRVPQGAASVDVQRDCSGPQSCIVARIESEIATLLGGTAADPAAALKFLAHFVGDVHQPLHVSLADDRGGFNIEGTYFGVPRNLHGVWDYGIIEHDGRAWGQIAGDLEAKITPAERAVWAASKPLDWANESLEITLAPAMRDVLRGDTFELGEAYEKINLPVALQRMQQAGVRLGGILTSVFNSPHGEK